MLTKEDYVSLLMTESLLPKILLILDIEGFITVKDKLNPSLETSTLNSPVKDTLKYSDLDLIEVWIDDWINLFSEKLKPYKLFIGSGNRQTCIKRMLLFYNKVSNDLDLIYRATELYIADCIANNRLSKLPQYFILPQVVGKIEKADIQEGELYDWFQKAKNGETTTQISIYDA